MQKPNFKEEKKLWEKGYEFVAGLDEAGRGPLAGPVVAAAVIVKKGVGLKIKANDSKKLSSKQRECVFELLIKSKDIQWGIGIVSEKIIDRINILKATKLAMKKSLSKLNPDYLLLDGNFSIDSKTPQKPIVSGDAKVFSISAASIIAKVTRDRIMINYDKKYPQYGFWRHKGYPTSSHRKILKKIGRCAIHRKSFRV